MSDRERQWLTRLAGQVIGRLPSHVAEIGGVPIVICSPVIEDATTNGYYVDVAHLPGGRRDRLQIWLDLFGGGPRRQVSFSYKTGDVERARLFGLVGIQGLGGAEILEGDWREDTPDGYVRRALPLQPHEYGKPFVELDEARGGWSFYTIYLADQIEFARRPRVDMVTQAVEFFGAVLGSAIDATGGEDGNGPEGERHLVRRHIVRERSAALARAAKVRDGYTCQVCGINFAVLYGPLGLGFAEAHHRIPLSSPLASRRTQVKDLVTVCANCHRMLHKLPSDRDGVPELRGLLTRTWPQS